MEQPSLPERRDRLMRCFTEELTHTYGKALVSVALYGSLARGEFSDTHSNINVAIVLTDTSLAALKGSRAILRKRAFRRIQPLFLTEEYIARSIDTFPIEFLDIQESHITLYGKEVFGALTIAAHHLKFQCEQELKAKLIMIKRAYVRVDSGPALRALVFTAFTSIIHLGRSLLGLKGIPTGHRTDEVIGNLAAHLAIHRAPFDAVHAAKLRRGRLPRAECERLLGALVTELETMANEVDRP